MLTSAQPLFPRSEGKTDPYSAHQCCLYSACLMTSAIQAAAPGLITLSLFFQRDGSWGEWAAHRVAQALFTACVRQAHEVLAQRVQLVAL
jgi:hypothetical protein